MKLGVLGAGSWGVGLATLLHKRGHRLRLWEFNAADAAKLSASRELPNKLPGVVLPDAVEVTNSVHDTVTFAELVVCAVPAQTTRRTMRTLAKVSSQAEVDAIRGWVIVSKGLEARTMKPLTDVLLDELPGLRRERLVVLSGPSHAEEVARHIPTTVVAASENHRLARTIQREFSTDTFRIYTNDDMVGVELAGAVKNVIALAAGICDGLGLGDNSKGALLTRGLVEMTRLGRAMGARDETFSGLAGMGDLITTCISRHSRNRKFGELIGSGLTMQEALRQMIMVAEGVETTRSVHRLAKKLKLEMPITEQVYLTLFRGKPVRAAVRDLMTREHKSEHAL